MVSSTGVCFLFLVSFLQFCRFFCVFLSFYIILGRKGVETNHPSSTWTATRLGEQCKGSYFHRTFYTRDQRPLAAWSGTQNSPGWVRLKTIFTELIKAGQLSETRKKEGRRIFYQVFKGWQLRNKIADEIERQMVIVDPHVASLPRTFLPVVVFHVRFRRPRTIRK